MRSVDISDSIEEFAAQVREVLIHLRDYVRLRGCSLCSFLFPAPSLEGPRRTQRYHRPLLVCPKPYMSHHVSQAFLE